MGPMRVVVLVGGCAVAALGWWALETLGARPEPEPIAEAADTPPADGLDARMVEELERAVQE